MQGLVTTLFFVLFTLCYSLIEDKILIYFLTFPVRQVMEQKIESKNRTAKLSSSSFHLHNIY